MVSNGWFSANSFVEAIIIIVIENDADTTQTVRTPTILLFSVAISSYLRGSSDVAFDAD